MQKNPSQVEPSMEAMACWLLAWKRQRILLTGSQEKTKISVLQEELEYRRVEKTGLRVTQYWEKESAWSLFG